MKRAIRTLEITAKITDEDGIIMQRIQRDLVQQGYVLIRVRRIER